MNLYKLTGEIRAINAEIEAADGEMSDETIARWESLEIALTDKVAGYIAVIRGLDHECAALRAEEERMRSRRKTREATIARLRDMLRVALEAAQTRSITTTLGSVSVREPRPSVDVFDAQMLAATSPHLVAVETTYKPDKRAIADALRVGDVVGARLVMGEPTVTIR